MLPIPLLPHCSPLILQPYTLPLIASTNPLPPYLILPLPAPFRYFRIRLPALVEVSYCWRTFTPNADRSIPPLLP